MKRATCEAAASRATPLRSSIAVRTIRTRESGSSTQSTGTSWMRRPRRCASTSSSVSKNQPSSRTSASSGAEHVAPDGLEAALGVGEARPQRRVQDVVVGARDELALRPAHDAGAVREPRADREVRVPRQQRRHERQQPAQVGREVDVHVADHPRAAGRPGGAQRAPAALAVQAEHVDAGQLPGEARGDRRRRVGRRVVGDHDPPRERELGREVAMEPPDAALQRRLLVVARGRRRRSGGGRGGGPRVAQEGGGGGRG